MSNLRSVKKSFNLSLNKSFKLIQKINSGTSQSRISLSPDDIDCVYEISFLKIITSWETFLEESFTLYLQGYRTGQFKPNKITKNVNEEKAYDLTKGTKPFPDWSNYSDVKLLANIYFFNGEPFITAVTGIEKYLSNMKTVRNAIAHISKSSKNSFITLARNELPSFSTSTTPGYFLRSQESISSKSFIEFYADHLRVATDLIIRT